ncbi:MAG: tRNA (adenosine(37)-N6)-dimethylallyltransferase MiaA [Acidobacteriota bacterium]
MLLVVAGPSGVGKSALAVALAERFGGEVIGADSMQVYRGLDVGTAKPSAEQRRRVPHHLVDCVDPNRDYSAGDYMRDADAAISAVAANGRLPVVAGGTGLYLRALLRGLVLAPRRQPRLRARLNRIFDRRGPAALWRILRRRDPEAAKRIAAADRQRLVRATEVALSGGAPLERLIQAHGFAEERYPAVRLGVDMPDKILLPRLERRVHAMFEEDRLPRELERLLAGGLRENANALRALGYREALACRRGEVSRAELAERTLRNTRRYVKRQRTWFRKEPGFRWFSLSGDLEADVPALEAWTRQSLAACARRGG